MAIPPDPYLIYLDTAWTQLATGNRPTADTVLRVVGGSKATAVAAMRHFWSVHLPDTLAGRRADAPAPKPVEDLLNRAWGKALELATAQANQHVQAERKALAQAIEATEAERANASASVLTIKTELADARASFERQKREALDALRTSIGQKQQAEISKHEARFAASEKTIGSLRSNIDQLQAQLHETRGKLGQVERDLAVRTAEIQASAHALEAAHALAVERQQALRAAQQQLHAQEADLATERDRWAEQSKEALTALGLQHDKQIAELNDRHNTLVQALKLEHVNQVDLLKKDIKKSRDAETKRTTRAKGK